MLNIFLIGLVSFFTDISTEMVYPLIPLYLTAVFGATPTLIGLIEGIAESLASLLKVFSGYATDRFQQKRRLAFLGYSTSLFYKLALILATSWSGILLARVIDRVGKGIRTTPRDVLVSESAAPGQLGRAFGIHKALDMAGSAVGILIAYFLVKAMPVVAATDQVTTNTTYKQLFLISIVPALIGLSLFALIKEQKVNRKVMHREPFWQNINRLNRPLKIYLTVAFLFTLGNSSNAFLLLRARSIGFDDASVILLYFIYSISAAVLAIPLGQRSDKIGRKRILVVGYLVFAMVYAGFAVNSSKWLMVVLFALYGLYTAMITGVERAFIAEIAPPALKGTLLGLHATLVGIALLPASLLAGLLWSQFGAFAPFACGSILSLLAALILTVFMKQERTAGDS
ncbi:MAG: MFS transporter [Eubacteriales bacterium]|nr:MFS transporter [Eubacteriales bacterium]